MPQSPGKCYVIAEIGVNHNGSVDLAKRLIDVAAKANCDAVKFQTFHADDLVSVSAKKADYQIKNTQNHETQYSMLKSLELEEEDLSTLSRYCEEKGIDFLSTPFSERAADLLERIGVSAYKISSGDLTHLDLLKHIGKKGRPIILSTGMGTLGEVETAIEAILSTGNEKITLLHCVSNYPAAPEDCNLAAMKTMAQAFGLPVGWSDHTIGSAVSWAAVARGCAVIEKHITLDRDLPGPDHKASMPPNEFQSFLEGIRTIEVAIGNGRKKPTEAEKTSAQLGRRSLTTKRDLRQGTVLAEDDIKVVRPGFGLAPIYRDMIVGCILTQDLPADSPLLAEHFQAND